MAEPAGRLELAAGDARLVVSPADGGRIASFALGGAELLVTADPRGPIYWGAYPMAPYAGRVREGRFAFEGVEHRLPVTMPPHAIHGLVLDRPWRVDDKRTISIDLAEPWPFPGRLVQRFSLVPGRLDVTLELHAAARMPASVGWHPWFRRSVPLAAGPASLSFAAAAMAARGPDGLPTGVLVAPPAPPWDDAFTGVTAPPAITWPGVARLELSSTCTWWVVYTQPEHALCVEPQSAPPNALNDEPEVVEPGVPLIHTMTWRWERPGA